jgi:hypothetical protein
MRENNIKRVGDRKCSRDLFAADGMNVASTKHGGKKHINISQIHYRISRS